VLELAAGIVFDGDPGNHGCGDGPNPGYVEGEDLELFERSWNVSDVVLAPLGDLGMRRGRTPKSWTQLRTARESSIRVRPRTQAATSSIARAGMPARRSSPWA
jgi:hypothetical protein